MMNSSACGSWFLWLILSPMTSASYFVKLQSDGPAVLDAPIIFTGRLLSLPGKPLIPELRAKWRFSDNVYPGHYHEFDSESSVKEYTVTYPSDQYDAGTYQMTLTIYILSNLKWKKVGKDQVNFRITSRLNGKLDITQDGIEREINGTEIVSCAKETTIDMIFHDPSNFLHNASIYYFWDTKNLSYVETLNGEFKFNFNNPGTYKVKVMIVALPSYTAQDTLHPALHMELRKTTLPLQLVDLLDKTLLDWLKFGIFQKALIAKLPISDSGTNVSGDVVLERGQTLNLNVQCDGSGDWSYCWSIKEKGYNITGNETCISPQYLQEECNFSIIYNLKNSSIKNYDVLIVISNDVSNHVEVKNVTVYDAPSTLPLSILVVIVAFSIFIIAVVTSGVALHAYYKTRVNTAQDEDRNTLTSPNETDSQDGTLTSGSPSV